MKTRLTKKDVAVWIIAIVAFVPCMLVFNESEHLWVNFIGFGYIGVLALVLRTKAGRMFFKRLSSIEDKLFNA